MKSVGEKNCVLMIESSCLEVFFVYIHFCSPRCFAICLSRVILIGFKRIIIENWVWCFGFFFSEFYLTLYHTLYIVTDLLILHGSIIVNIDTVVCVDVKMCFYSVPCSGVYLFLSVTTINKVLLNISTASRNGLKNKREKKSKMLHSKQCDEQWGWHSVTLY